MKLLALVSIVAALMGCGAAPPPPKLVHLPTALPSGISPPAPLAKGVWQLLPLRLPEYLDRDALLVPQGQAGLQPLPGWRWAEPLRESVPRVLREDLALLLGPARLWTSPLPPGVPVPQQLRVEVLAFESTSDRGGVRLHARWTITDALGVATPRAGSAVVEVRSRGIDGDALAAAHREALWGLAQRIAAMP